MADLLTHAFIAYTIGTLLSIRYEWLTPRYVTLVMIGSILPDLSRMSLLVSAERIELLTGLPFSWFAFHTIGGVFVTTTMGALLTTDARRRQVFGLLLVGAFSHLALDAVLLKPAGYSAPMWWPVITHRLPTPGLYQSPDRWPAVASGIAAALAWYIRATVSIDDLTERAANR
jgi:hypothetical protein